MRLLTVRGDRHHHLSGGVVLKKRPESCVSCNKILRKNKNCGCDTGPVGQNKCGFPKFWIHLEFGFKKIFKKREKEKVHHIKISQKGKKTNNVSVCYHGSDGRWSGSGRDDAQSPHPPSSLLGGKKDVKAAPFP